MEVNIASASSLPSGKMIGIENGGKRILIANLNGQFYAIGNTCTHMGCTLSEGTLKKERVQCPCHGSTFDIRDGKVLKGPAKNPEPSFKLKVVGDQVLATL